MVSTPERFTSSVARKGEERNTPEGGDRKFGQYQEEGTTIMARKGEPTKSGHLTFDLGGMSTINWRISGGQVSESTRSRRGNPNLDPSQNPTESSTIPIPEEYYKRLTCTPRLGESQLRSGPFSFLVASLSTLMHTSIISHLVLSDKVGLGNERCF